MHRQWSDTLHQKARKKEILMNLLFQSPFLFEYFKYTISRQNFIDQLVGMGNVTLHYIVEKYI